MSANAPGGWTGRAASSSPVMATAFHQSLLLSGGSGTPSIRSNRSTIAFEGGSGFATPATLTVCDRRGARAARAVIVSRSGGRARAIATAPMER